MICLHCGAPVIPVGNAWIHQSASESVLCDWLRSRRADDDPVVLDELEAWLR